MLAPYAFLSFFAFGLALVLVGANQAPLAAELELDLAGTGMLTASLSLGLGVGVVGAGPLFDRYPRTPLFAGSMLLAAAALGTVERGMGLERWLLHLAVTGLGIGAYDTAVSAVVVQRFRQRSARSMSVIHSAATLGAIGGPLLAGWLTAGGDWIRSFHLAAGAHLVLALAALAVPFPPPEPAPPERSGDRLSLALLPFAVVAFAYVGVEAGLTVFAVPYAGHLGLDAERGQLGISALWLGLLTGRLGVLALPRALDAGMLAGAGFAAAVIVGLGSVAPLGQVAGTLFAGGVALGCVYPLMITLAAQAFPHARGTAAGLAAGAGALGGFGVPWLAGALGDRAGVEAAIASMAGWCAVIGAAALAARERRERRER